MFSAGTSDADHPHGKSSKHEGPDCRRRSNTRNGLREILAAEGYETLAAENGKEALRLFAKESPDFVCLES